MTTSGHAWKSAVLFLLTVGAGTALAEKGVAYASISSGSVPTVDPTRSLNPGGPVTVLTTGTGAYTVGFPNSGLGDGWAVMASASHDFVSGVSSNYCNVAGWNNSSLVYIQCYDFSGLPVNCAFTVMAASNANDKFISFALASLPTTASYAPDVRYAYNQAHGAMNITRTGPGSYSVTFGGLPGQEGTVQVSAFGGNATCSPGTVLDHPFVGGVSCFDPSGNPVDSLFVIWVFPSNIAGLTFVLADQESAPSYTGQPTTSWNVSGQQIDIARESVGQYVVTLYGANATGITGGNYRVTAFSSTVARCSVKYWSNGGGGSINVFVNCFNLVGGAADCKFELLGFPPAGYAYAYIPDPSGAGVSSIGAVNPVSGNVGLHTLGTGLYLVSFDYIGIGYGWSAQAVAVTATSNYCKVENWDGSGVTVGCYTAAGLRADTPFSVSAISDVNGLNMSFAEVAAVTPTIYSAKADYSYNSGGQIDVIRSSAGVYTVTFNGLNGAGAAVQITAMGTNSATCGSGAWGGANLSVVVGCRTASGAAIDSAFVIAVIPGGITSFSYGYAWASQPTAASYAADASFSYDDFASFVAVTRFGVGQYNVTFPNLNWHNVFGGNILVTAYKTANRCAVGTWNTTTLDIVVAVDCFNTAGDPADTEYQVLALAPIVGPPFRMQESGIQTTPATYPFPSPMVVEILDANDNPISDYPVTFSAPASGPSGTFPGPSLMATALTDFHGIATAPVFTANNIVGSYTVATTAPGIGSLPFLSNNTPVTAVTLQTSPPGLQVSLDGSATAAPLTVQLVPGVAHTIAVTTPQTSAGSQYAWLNWSDGGAISHSTTIPATATTYTATFQAQYQLTISASPPAGGSVTPASGAYYNSGTVVPVTATANPGYSFSSWSGAVASTSSASTTVTMAAAETITANFSSLSGITIQTNPPGLQFSVDGGPAQTAPATLQLSQATHTIAVVTTQSGGAGKQYVFTGWSDTGNASHTITVGSTAATYTASFKTQYQLTTLSNPAAGGSVSPATGAYYDSGSSVNVTATPNSLYAFTSWSGDATGSANPISVTMSSLKSVTAHFTLFTCDLNGDSSVGVADVQLIVNEALGAISASHDLNHDGVVNVLDVQKEINAAVGLGCQY